MTNDASLICLLDVLGFEALFNRYCLEIIEEKYKELITVVEEQNIGMAVTRGPGGYFMVCSPNIKAAYFSDTIIFWCKYDVFRMEVLLNCMKEVICKSIEIGLPLRGSVSVGEAKLEKEQSIFIGLPIIAAARAEPVQKWIGITLSKSFDKKPYCDGFKPDCILQYDKHLKLGWQDKVIPLVIDFPRQWRIKRQTSLTEAIQKLNNSEQYAEYYDNTIAFAQYSEENHDWWTKRPEYIEEVNRMKNQKTDEQPG